MDAKMIGKTIAALRKKKGLTQLELAKKLSVSDKAVSKWELGGCYPDITLFPMLADLFGVSIDYLMRGNSRTVQHLKSGWFGDNFRKSLNGKYLANGWRITDLKLTGDGEGGGLIAAILEKEVYDE